jgi:hypothetical protein
MPITTSSARFACLFDAYINPQFLFMIINCLIIDGHIDGKILRKCRNFFDENSLQIDLEFVINR